MNMQSYSLTRRLIGAVLMVQLCSTLVLPVCAGVYEGVSHFRALDVMLRGRADSILGAVQDAEDPQDNVMLDGTQTAVPRRDIYAVRDEQGRLLGQSPNWPDASAEFSNTRQFHDVTIDRHEYRVIRVEGTRMVDPGDKGGGIARHVVILYGLRTHPVWEAIAHAVIFYAAISLFVLAVTAWVMKRVLGRGLRPLRELADQAALISADHWMFAPSSESLEIRELAPLGLALQSVLSGLERSFEQQKQFVSDAAHELKTAVAVVKSSLQLVMMRERNPEEYRAGLRRVEQDCERMEELVGTMLTLAKLESDLETPSAGSQTVPEVNLEELVRDVAEHLHSSAEVFGVSLSIEADATLTVSGEREKVRLLCSNLLHNAIQHSMQGAQVRILLEAANGRGQMRVVDTGEGIALEALPHVFDRFYRGDVSRSRRTGGMGLGLSICKAIVQSMGGSITIESKLGEGTTVLVDLPIVSSRGDVPKAGGFFSLS